MKSTSVITEPSGTYEETDSKHFRPADDLAAAAWDLPEAKGDLVLVVGAEPTFRDISGTIERRTDPFRASGRVWTGAVFRH
jgi:hypothetical protein